MQPGSQEHEECLHMALALEGIAGALHTGQRVDARDVAQAALAAEKVWEAGPDPGPSREDSFGKARGRMAHAANGCAAGSARDAARVELAAHELARELRWMAQDLAARPPRAPAWDQVKVIRDLQAKYARFGFRPAA